jgi:hypothetical protein
MHHISPVIMAMVPTARQYSPKYNSLPFLTMDIIHLQARSPEIKAAMNPISSGNHPMDKPAVESCPSRSTKLAAMMGRITIRKEKRAASSRLFPRNSAVVMVAPERDIPGSTANACVMPITIESR